MAMPLDVLLLLLLGLSSCFTSPRSQAQSLHPREVEVWRQMAIKLKMDEKLWNFSANPSNRLSDAGLVNDRGRPARNISLDCSFENNTVCHIIYIQLTRQNLTGVLPEEMANFTYLKYLDLSRNYLNGTIPSAWASLPVLNLSIHGNRISGRIPKELGNMPVIKSLQFENNQLEGPLPAELGNLASLQRLFVSSNNISGVIPDSFANLRNMTDFRIDGTSISGTVPAFIRFWQKVNRIDMVGTSLAGPLPREISSLSNLTELRVSDLSGPGMVFPPLQNAVHLTELVLRNCSIFGEIPQYLGSMMYLEVLDLSFNKLTGKIPSGFENMILEYLYLTNNDLTGEVPKWMFRNLPSSKKNMDISYNNFTGSPPSTCQEGNLNMVSSYESSTDKSIDSCFRKGFPCISNEQYNSLFVNCGGNNVVIEGIEYDSDSSEIGTSTFSYGRSRRWAYSSTGDFVGNEDANYIATNSSMLNMTDSALYTEARLAPISLKYYGLCLENGNYSVSLHFAEIVFPDDQTYVSIGKRYFDVFIQGKKVLKDFNIKEEAGGYGHPIIMNFTALVEDNTLVIHLYWAGKGTNAIPIRGYYGPLISAISVRKVSPRSSRGGRLSLGAIIGIAVTSCVFLLFVVVMLWLKYFSRGFQKSTVDEDEHPRLPRSYFSLKEIEVATGNFDPINKVGEGGFGVVYKGVLRDGTQVAVKQMSPISRQGNREFLNEFGMVSALQHPNLVTLFGCCTEGDQLLLIYEYMENNSLGRALFGEEQFQVKLNWPKRFSICLGIARGLEFLHESSLRVVHRDIKPGNILLDKDFNPKIADFGLAKLYEKEKTHISTRIAGTLGYMAPEYATRGYLSDKADVFSFGVVTLELISGKRNTDLIQENELVYLIDWALILQAQGKLLELVDPTLGSDYPEAEALKSLQVSLLCTNPSPSQRPTMAAVVKMLTGEVPISMSDISNLSKEAPSAEGPNSHPSLRDIKRHDGQWQLPQKPAEFLESHYDIDSYPSPADSFSSADRTAPVSHEHV